MTPDQQIDRSVLAGKDRDELHTIAGAIGVKAATRMRKADLIDAILTAANGGEAPADAAADPEPAKAELAAKPRRVRSTRSAPPADDDLAALAAEEDALGGDATEDEPLPRPRARRAAPAPVEEPDTSDDRADDAGSDAAGDTGHD
jgi:transcription termination factor Rho